MAPTTNALSIKFSLFGVSQGSRRVLDSATIGFAANPGSNHVERVLSPAGESNSPPATTIVCAVRSFLMLRTSGKVKITINKGSNPAIVLYVTSVFAYSPDGLETITIETAETTNVTARVTYT